MIDLELPDKPNLHYGVGEENEKYRFMFDNWEENLESFKSNVGNTYHITFLIELDPL